MVDVDELLLISVAQPKEPQVQVLHTTVMLGVVDGGDGGLIVHVEDERGCAINVEVKLFEELAHPDDLLSGDGGSNKLGLSGRESDDALLLALPADRSRPYLQSIPRGGFACVDTSSVVGVAISDEGVLGERGSG